MALETQGTVVAINTGTTATPVWTPIGEVKSFNGPSGSATVIDATHLGSVAKDKLMGLADEGQITLEVNYLHTADAGQSAVRTARTNRTLSQFQITLSDGTSTIAFSAYVLGFTVSGGVDALMTSTITLEISGAVTYA